MLSAGLYNRIMCTTINKVSHVKCSPCRQARPLLLSLHTLLTGGGLRPSGGPKSPLGWSSKGIELQPSKLILLSDLRNSDSFWLLVLSSSLKWARY